jgi:hypothetical protein
VNEDEAWEGHVTVDHGELRLPFLGREELLKNKAAAGRPKDLADIALLAEGDQRERGDE